MAILEKREVFFLTRVHLIYLLGISLIDCKTRISSSKLLALSLYKRVKVSKLGFLNGLCIS